MSGEGVHNVYDDAVALAAIEVNRLLILVVQAGVATVLVDLATVDAIVDAILAIVEGLPTLTAAGTAVITTVLNTEYNIYVNAVPLGIFNPIGVNIDCRAHTAGETIVVRYYEQIAAGVPDPILVDELTYAGAVDRLIKVEFPMPNRFGIWVTIERTGGAARTYIGEPFYEI